MLSTSAIVALAQKYQSYIVSIRRHLHQYPELSWQEDLSIAFIKNEILKILASTSLKAELIENKGGLVLDLNINPSYDRILFRADVDALPIDEQTTLDFKSKHPGIMHSCGHDCHAAMLLGALKALCETKLTISHNLRFVWQRAEEIILTAPYSGGESLIQDHVLDGISHVYGLHISSKNTNGVFFSKPGAMLANAAHLAFKIRCLGGHVMHPEKGSNAIDILADIHYHLKSFVLNSLGSSQPVSLVPSTSHAGSACNVMPSEGYANYSMRTFLSLEESRLVIAKLEAKIRAIVALYDDATLEEFQFYPGYPPLVNPAEIYENVKMLLHAQNFETNTIKPLFAGEDFAFYLSNRPGSYWLLGAKTEPEFDHHTPYFNPNESVFWRGAAFWMALALNS
ncbi:MAG: M20 family metallopeptidase [Chlamydiota bacterium]